MTVMLFLAALALAAAMLVRFVRNDRLGGRIDLRVLQAAHRVTARPALTRGR